MAKVSTSSGVRLSAIGKALRPFGLICFGVSPVFADELGDLGRGHVVLIGNIGGGDRSMWDVFSRFCDAHDSKTLGDHPLDFWTRHVLSPLGLEFGGRMVYPFSVPALPFIRWALRSGVFFRSPIGVVIHPVYGVWTAFRGALFFPADIVLEDDAGVGSGGESPCISCIEKPCLGGCPVGAFGGDGGYDVPSCVAHITATRNDSADGCYNNGCRARLSCPVGVAYAPAQRRFHMRAFLSSR